MVKGFYILLISLSPHISNYSEYGQGVYHIRFETTETCREHMRSVGKEIVAVLDLEDISAKFEFWCE